jgi:hypothetical protein
MGWMLYFYRNDTVFSALQRSRHPTAAKRLLPRESETNRFRWDQVSRIVFLIFLCSPARLDSRDRASRENLRQVAEHG